MRFEEIDQDLEAQFGKETSQTIADANIEYCIEILNNRVINEKFDANVEQPSIDATAIMLLALTKYPHKTFRELAMQRPAVKKALLYCIVKGVDNYDEVHYHIKDVLKKHAGELNLKVVNNFLNILQVVAPAKSAKFSDCMNFPERFEDISRGLHHLIDGKGDKLASLVIMVALDDGLLKPTTSRKTFVDEFALNKSGFNKFMTDYENNRISLGDQRKKTQIQISLRNVVGYSIENDKVIFNKRLGKRNILKLIANFLKR